jgi:hypothetical protein
MADFDKPIESDHFKQALSFIESHQAHDLKHLLRSHPTAVSEADVKDRTLLHYAVLENDLKLVETVTKFHPDFNNCHDEDGLLPIHLAMKKNNIQIIKALIQHGADTNAQAEEGTYSGYTILHFAVTGDYCSSDDTAQVVSLPQINIEVADEKRRTAAHIAAYHNQIDCLKILHVKGAEMDKKDEHKITPLMLAACRGNIAPVTYLLNNTEVEINLQDKAGDSALHLAVQVQVQRVFNYNFPLEEDHYECAYILTRHGIDIEMLNREGDSALDIVNEDFAELLELVHENRKFLPADKTLKELCLLPATVFIEAGMNPEAAVKVFNSCGKWMGAIEEKNNAEASRTKPCSLIKTDKVPRMRKFKELLEQTEKDGVANGEQQQQFEHDEDYYYKKYENSSAKCPFGFSAEDKAKNSNNNEESQAKCPFGFTAENAGEASGAQNGHIAKPNGETVTVRGKPASWKIIAARIINDSTFWLTASMGLVVAAAFAYHKYQK